MDTIIHYTLCPVCGSDQLKELWRAKDNTVSDDSFLLMDCSACTLRFTQDVPDADSIGKYYKSENYISHTNTRKGIINRLYHFVRERTLRRKRKMIVRATGISNGRLLDIGSGTGAFVREMKGAGWECTGLEPDAAARDTARLDFNVHLDDIASFHTLIENRFDAITMWHVLEHVHDLQEYVQRLSLLLSPKGRIFIAVPNYTSHDAEVYKNFWAAYDVPRHLYHFSPASMKVLVEKNGLQILGYKPMWYDSFYISLLSSQYKNGKANWPGAATTALVSNLKALGNTKRCSSVIYVLGRLNT